MSESQYLSALLKNDESTSSFKELAAQVTQNRDRIFAYNRELINDPLHFSKNENAKKEMVSLQEHEVFATGIAAQRILDKGCEPFLEFVREIGQAMAKKHPTMGEVIVGQQVFEKMGTMVLSTHTGNEGQGSQRLPEFVRQQTQCLSETVFPKLFEGESSIASGKSLHWPQLLDETIVGWYLQKKAYPDLLLKRASVAHSLGAAVNLDVSGSQENKAMALSLMKTLTDIQEKMLAEFHEQLLHPTVDFVPDYIAHRSNSLWQGLYRSIFMSEQKGKTSAEFRKALKRYVRNWLEFLERHPMSRDEYFAKDFMGIGEVPPAFVGEPLEYLKMMFGGMFSELFRVDEKPEPHVLPAAHR